MVLAETLPDGPPLLSGDITGDGDKVVESSSDGVIIVDHVNSDGDVVTIVETPEA